MIAKHRAEMDAAYRLDIDARRTALELLQNPFLTYFANLDTPALIIQTGIGDFPTAIFIDRHIEAMNSWVKVLVNTDVVQDNGVDTDFTFYFLWSNNTDQPAVIVNAATSLVFNGTCRVFAAGDTGLFSDDSDYADVMGQLTVWRWRGWIDPITGQNFDQTQVVLPGTPSGSVVGLKATGGGLFGNEGIDPKNQPQEFNNQALDLNAGPLAVPPGAEVLFEVAMTLQYGFTAGGGDISDLISVDFANDELGYLVRCPGVLHEVSGPVPPNA